MRTGLLVVVALTAACATTSSSSAPSTPAQSSPEPGSPAQPTKRPDAARPVPTKFPPLNEWLSLKMKGQKLGYLHTVFEPGRWNGIEVELGLTELGFSASIGSRSSRFEKAFSKEPPGQLIGFRYQEVTEGQRPQLWLGTCTPEALVVVSQRPNAPDETLQLPPCRETLADSYLAYRAAISRTLQEGRIMTTATEEKPSMATFLSEDTLETPQGGVPVVRVQVDEETHFLTPDGRIVRVEYGQALVGEAATEAEARDIGSADIAKLARIRLARPFSPAIAKAPATAVVVIENLNKTQVPHVPNRQSVEALSGRLRVTISSHQPLAQNLNESWLKDPDVKPTARFDADAPTVVEFAKKAVGGEKNAWLAAQRLAAAIQKTVAEKNGLGAAQASETLAARQGTRPDFTMLFIALARASGIPAREVHGLVASGSFMYAMTWAEIFVGEWIAVDPSVDGLLAPPDHLQLIDSSAMMNAISKGDVWVEVER